MQSINLQSATDVLVTGYVWQRYADDVPAGIARAVSFPEMESGSITEAYRRRGRGETVIGWSFSMTLRQTLRGQNRYPLDDVDVRIRLWPHDFDKNVILVPDLEAYTTLIPSSLPGLTANASLVAGGAEVSEDPLRATASGKNNIIPARAIAKSSASST